MRTDESNNKHLIAEDGKVFRRISDGWIAGPEIYLGKTYHLGGERLDTPLEELPGHYEEIDDPVAAETVLLDEDTDMEEAVRPMIAADASPEPPDDLPPEPPRVTLADYRALERKVETMMRLLESTIITIKGSEV